MDKQRWQQIKDLFLEALDRDPDERSAFLDEACGEDAELRAEVDLLLASHEEAEAEQRFEQPVLDAESHDRRPSKQMPLQGARIGNYRILRELGRGGMGTVYLGERADGQFDQQVAIKFVRREHRTDELLRRFRHERRILASLQHPNIARLLDGGVTEEGRPYLVMEYVEGRPITEYCDTHRLSTTQRLDLFRTVCAAVQYAHQNLVVHRDLKPSNILVTPASGGTSSAGQVKLLDFGIAKLLDEGDDTPDVPLTQTGMRVLTPEYASPEQVRGEPITTASDVYALGIILYELLSGRRPYQVRGLSPSEAERVICEEEPDRPSTQVADNDERPEPAGATRLATPKEISQARRTEPERLRRQLEGDLDTIVLVALRKEPARRYASVEQLSEDLRRYLKGLPVAARPDTVSYRVSKFVRRHRAGVAAVLLVMLTLLGGIAATAWQAQVAAAERDRAQAEATKAERINTFLQEMLNAVDPHEDGRDVTVAEVLEQAAQQVETELADQPEIEAAVRQTIGVTYQNLGLYAAAEEHLRRSLDLHRRHLHSPPQEIAQSLKDFALVKHWQGDLEAADQYYQQAIASFREQDARNVGFADALNDYGTLLIDQGAYEEAEQYFREALAIRRVVQGDEHIDIATGLTNVALARHYLEDVEAADSLYRKALAMQHRLVGPDHLEVAYTLNNLGWVQLDKDNPAGADSLFRASLRIRRQQLGNEHLSVALALNNLAALIYLPQQDYAGADTLIQEALAICRASTSGDHPYTSNVLYTLGRLRSAQHKLQQAEARFRQALAMRTRLYGKEHPVVATTKMELGVVLSEQERYEEAHAVLRSSLATLEQADHSNAENARRALADLYEAWGKPEQAQAMSSDIEEQAQE